MTITILTALTALLSPLTTEVSDPTLSLYICTSDNLASEVIVSEPDPITRLYNCEALDLDSNEDAILAVRALYEAEEPQRLLRFYSSTLY